MNRRLKIVVFGVVFLFPILFSLQVLNASVREAGSSYNADVEEYPLGRDVPGFALLGGGAFMRIDDQWSMTPTVAARYYFHKRNSDAEGPRSLSPWSVELGMLLPTGQVIENRTVGSAAFYTLLHDFSEQHAAVQYRWSILKPLRMTPELSVGISHARLPVSVFVYDPTRPLNYENLGQTRNSISPMVRVGLPLIANDWFSIRLDLGYLHHANKVTVQGQTFDFGLSGIGIYPSAQIHIGNLTPSVQPGVFLPSNALPLWALSAIQTERRSPIIAPQEAMADSRQAVAQGHLSGNALFQYKSRWARKVEIIGDFNRWQPEPMYMVEEHVWVTIKDLPPGDYHYNFLIDGRREIRDPWNNRFDAAARGSSLFTVQKRER